MSDRDALYAAILAHPDEDTPRLAYADWLDEHGNAKDKKHAEFIRAQCELAHLDREDAAGTLFVLGDALDWRHDSSTVRRLQLQKVVERQHEKMRDLITPLQIDPSIVWGKRLVRGFPTCVAVYDFALSESALMALAAASVQEIHAFSLPEKVAAVVGAHWPSSVRHLRISSPPTAAAIEMLAKADRVRGVSSVRFDQTETDAVTAIARSEAWSGVEGLSIYAGSGGDQILSTLAGSPLRERLTTLHLADVRVTTSAGLRAMTRTTWPRLRTLRLPQTRIGDDAVVALAKSKGFPQLQTLDLSGTRVSGTGVGAVLSSPTLAQLRDVNFSNNGDMTIEPISAPPAPALRTVTLTGNTGFASGKWTAPLYDLLSRSTVVFLNLSHITFETPGVKAITQTSGWPQLRALSLSSCNMPPGAAIALAEWPGLAKVEWLGLHDPNPFGRRGGKAIANSRYLGRIRELVVPKETQELRKRFGRKLTTEDRVRDGD